MSDAIYPTNLPGLTLDTTFTPIFNTLIQSSESGAENRMALQIYPKWQVDLKYEFLRSNAGLPELQQLLGFYLARLGPSDSFLFASPVDSTVALQPIGAGNGTNKDFQLMRALGGFSEPVFWPVQASVQAYVGSTPVASSVGAYGMLTLAVAPTVGASVFWSGSYYYRARFADDKLDIKRFMYNLWSAGKVALVASLQDKVR